MGWVIYDNAKLLQMTGSAFNFDTSGDTLKVMLCTSAYSPNQTTHTTKADVTNEVSGSNYTARGAALASKTATIASHVFKFDCADITWLQHATGFSNARIAVCYKDSGADNTSPLVAYYDLVSDRGNVAGDLVLGTPSGIWTI
jgi:hypothetical protein